MNASIFNHRNQPTMKILIRSRCRAGLSAALVTLFGVASLQGAVIPKPVWFGDANTTYQSYTFSTSSTTPAPETLTNPYGTPDMEITVVPYIGVGTGYQDPSDPLDIHRVDGAWDLGPDGSIAIDVPVAPTPGAGESYIVDVVVSVVYEPTAGLYNVPDIIYTPSSIASTTEKSDWEADGFFFWGLKTSETTIGNVPTELINVLVDATGDTGSLIDTVEVHTRYTLVPEPQVYALFLGVGALGLILVRRWRRRLS